MKMIDSLQARSEVKESLTWDLKDLFQSEKEFEDLLEEINEQALLFTEKYAGRLEDADTVIEALRVYERNKAYSDQLELYAQAKSDTDMTNSENLNRLRKTKSRLAKISGRVSFFKGEVLALDKEILDEISQKAPEYAPYVRHLKVEKDAQLDPKVERYLAEYTPVFAAPLETFEQVRSNDLEFGTFVANGKEYPLSFVLYEEFYMYHKDQEVRRQAYKKFSEVLEKYQYGLASNYYSQVQREKIEATNRGYDSVINYLLLDQEVTRGMYERQIDIIMEEFAPVMRKYMRHIKEVNELDTLYYADLRMDLDPGFGTSVTIERAEEMIYKALKPLGRNYINRTMLAFSERWIDFPRNEGKGTGASCHTAYGKHPYITLSWADRLDSVYTLIHELGHAGQAIYTNEKQVISASKPSLYILEAPSTFNELLLTDHLLEESDSPRSKRAILAKMVSKTFFHNFVTHLLEAAYQREVYHLIDEGEGVDANVLNRIKREVIAEFWGDEIELEPGVEYTWMRQRHYFRGLYPYTYSAGLTLSTQAFLNWKREGQVAMDRWLEFLKLGNSKRPLEAADFVHVDMRDEQSLLDTIDFVDYVVDRIIELTEEINNQKA